MPTELVNITTAEIARRFGVRGYTVRRWVEQGVLTPSFVTPGGHYRFTEADIQAFTAARTA